MAEEIEMSVGDKFRYNDGGLGVVLSIEDDWPGDGQVGYDCELHYGFTKEGRPVMTRSGLLSRKGLTPISDDQFLIARRDAGYQPTPEEKPRWLISVLNYENSELRELASKMTERGQVQMLWRALRRHEKRELELEHEIHELMGRPSIREATEVEKRGRVVVDIPVDMRNYTKNMKRETITALFKIISMILDGNDKALWLMLIEDSYEELNGR